MSARPDPPTALRIGRPYTGLRRRRGGAVAPPPDPVTGRQGVNPTLYLLPNLFTSASLFLALTSIVKVSEGLVLASQGLPARAEFIMACWMILFAAMCDAVDGPVARLTHTSSSFGLQYDSLADLVAFGVAPALLMYANLRTFDETLLPVYAPKLALAACALYVICAAIRLARFNIQAETSEKRHFVGLPSPGAAGTVVTAYLFVEWLSALPGWMHVAESASPTRMLHRGILLLMVGLALLMVSEIPFGKLRHLLRISEKPFNSLVVLMVVFCGVIMFIDYLPAMLFAAFMVYILSTLVATARRRLMAWRRGQPAAIT
jgi:CDP-diacylglycerol--serine O-phosphatidyltransferase